MSSAASYTNRRRVLAEASITKVQYPGRIANNNDSILSVCNSSPDYSTINYTLPVSCKNTCQLTIVTLDGGNYSSEPDKIYDGGNAFIESTLVLDGGNS